MLRIAFDNSYARLPPRLFARCNPTAVAAPGLVRINRPLAASLGIDPDALASPDGVAALAGNLVPIGAEPIALAYAGHQFGGFSPQLGDGRAILLGEVVGRDGLRRDIQLKGSGPTPYSRNGDGRAALGPVLREYIVSEAMAALGVPTTRALAAVTTGQPVLRERVLPGAVLTRVAASHLRIGTFEFFAARRDTEALRALVEYALARHDPDIAVAEPARARALLGAVVARQAALVAQWLLLGFVHGVMNTDNTAISGETIDYGPCAFIDGYDPGATFSSIDHAGRYAYDQQPGIAQWNLTRLAEALLPLMSDDADDAVARAEVALAGFAPAFQDAYARGLRRKIGLQTERTGDTGLVAALLATMATHRTDWTGLFRALSDTPDDADAAGPPDRLADWNLDADWWHAWRARLALEPASPAARGAAMRAANPAIIPRNHMVEAALAAAVERHDFSPFEELLAACACPYDPPPGLTHHAAVPPPAATAYRTFCGT